MAGAHRGLEQGTEPPGTGAKDSCKPACGMAVHMHRHTCVEGGQTGRWAFPSAVHFPSLTEPEPGGSDPVDGSELAGSAPPCSLEAHISRGCW